MNNGIYKEFNNPEFIKKLEILELKLLTSYMNENLKKVQDFYRLFDSPVLDKKDTITKERAILRLSLALEELTELAEAFGLSATFSKMMIKKATEKIVVDTDIINKKEILDALCDIQYINNGTVLETGFRFDFDNAFNDVHESNMSKACSTPEEAVLTVEKYHKEGIETYFKEYHFQCNGYRPISKYIVFRTSDNKVLKSINYKKVDLDKYL